MNASDDNGLEVPGDRRDHGRAEIFQEAITPWLNPHARAEGDIGVFSEESYGRASTGTKDLARKAMLKAEKILIDLGYEMISFSTMRDPFNFVAITNNEILFVNIRLFGDRKSFECYNNVPVYNTRRSLEIDAIYFMDKTHRKRPILTYDEIDFFVFNEEKSVLVRHRRDAMKGMPFN